MEPRSGARHDRRSGRFVPSASRRSITNSVRARPASRRRPCARAEAASEGLGECVLRLERLGAIRGNVRWRDGSAADGATVFADPTLGAGAEFRTAVADADGVFEFAGLPPGTYVVSARSSESGDVRPDGTVTRGRRGVARVEDVVVDGEPLEIVLGSGSRSKATWSTSAAPR